MTGVSQIRAHMEVIGPNGVHLGLVDRLEGKWIKLTEAEAPAR